MPDAIESLSRLVADLQVALDLGRRAIGIEINPEYVALIQRRLTGITLGLSLEHSP